MSEKMTNATAAEVRSILEKKVPSILKTNDILKEAMGKLEDVNLIKSPITRNKAMHLRWMVTRFESALAGIMSELRDFYN